jgi:predicted nucleic acid-binding protein
MAIDRTTRLLLDASCLVAAAYAPRGGSAHIVRLSGLGFLAGWASQGVLVEAARVLGRGGSLAVLAEYDALLRRTGLRPARIPGYPVRQYLRINAKDAHVYAAARACRAAYLITLDQPLIAQCAALSGPPVALSPGAFLQQVLPEHSEYAADPQVGQLP